MQRINNMVDGKTLKLADLDLDFIATKASNFTHKRNPERALVRHNWIEIFFRICQTKYFKNGAGGPNVKTFPDCFRMMMQDNLIPYFSQFDSHKWRKSICWKEDIDLTLKQNLTGLRDVYRKWSGRNNTVGAPKFMSLSEFTDLMTEANVLNDDFGQK
jgi:hypothetical protein